MVSQPSMTVEGQMTAPKDVVMNSWTACRMASNLAVAFLERRTSTFGAAGDQHPPPSWETVTHCAQANLSDSRHVCLPSSLCACKGDGRCSHEDNAWSSIKVDRVDHVLQLTSWQRTSSSESRILNVSKTIPSRTHRYPSVTSQ